MPKPRKKKNKGLPPRWRYKHNAIYYRVPPGTENQWDNKKEFRLGKTLAEAHTEYAKHIKSPPKIYRIDELMTRYHNWAISQNQSKSSLTSKINSRKRLEPAIGEMAPADLESEHIEQILEIIESKHGRSTARVVYSYLSSMYTKAVKWKIVDRHPMKFGQVDKPKASTRDRYVENWELAEALKVAPEAIKAHIHFKLVTGLRKSDILKIRLDGIFRTPDHLERLRKTPHLMTVDDLREGGLPVKPAKTQDSSGKKNRYTWSPSLISAIVYALESNPCLFSEYLITNRKCESYFNFEKESTSGFDSAWQRWQKKAIAETKLTEKFQEKDLRAKVASDTDLQHASMLLSHTKEQITEQVYRRKGEEVDPAVIDSTILKHFNQ